MLPCLVLGGGRGTRMRPATDTVPKPLLVVAGEPFAVHQLRWLASEGVTDVVYSIGYLGGMIRDALTVRTDLPCSIRFVEDGTTLLGTGGAVRRAIDETALDGPFFVLYGDSYLQLELQHVVARFTNSGREALMTVFRNDGELDRSNAIFDGTLVVRYDKNEPSPADAGMRYIDYGLSILQPETVREHFPNGEHGDLARLFQALSAQGRLAGYEVRHRFFEIGSTQGLVDLEHHLGQTLP
jgi:MurNAc alpha-1-phosphate uridylyltransferase